MGLTRSFATKFATPDTSFVRLRYFHTESFRLSAIYALVFALSVALIGVMVLLINRHALREQILQSARTSIVAMQRAYDQEGIREVHEVIGQLKGVPGASELFLLQKNGNRVEGNLPAMPPRTGTIEFTPRDRQAIVLGIGANLAPGLYAFSGSELTRVHVVQAQIQQTLVWVFLAAMLLAALGGILISRSFLSRTDAMAKACRSIMDGDLKTRLPVRGTRDELDRLASTVNEMLDRIAILMDNIGQVTNDIAHDLRTPVTHLRQRLERGKQDSADAEKSEAAFEASIEKTDEILAMFAALLRIVQIEGGSRRATFTKVDLTALLQQSLYIFMPVSEAAHHTLTLDAQDNVFICGDRALLLQMFSNLIENSIIHTPIGTNIWLRLTMPKPNLIAIRVADDGPGVPADERHKLFRRLYRREASRATPGYGLGLSVVSAIAELHAANIEIEDTDRGFSICVTFNSASE